MAKKILSRTPLKEQCFLQRSICNLFHVSYGSFHSKQEFCIFKQKTKLFPEIFFANIPFFAQNRYVVLFVLSVDSPNFGMLNFYMREDFHFVAIAFGAFLLIIFLMVMQIILKFFIIFSNVFRMFWWLCYSWCIFFWSKWNKSCIVFQIFASTSTLLFKLFLRKRARLVDKLFPLTACFYQHEKARKINYQTKSKQAYYNNKSVK